jgi:hypothetical protein
MSVPADRMGPPAPHVTIGPQPGEARPTATARRVGAPHLTPDGLAATIAADPALTAWLRDYGAGLLEAAADELRDWFADPSSALICERRARDHRAAR